MIISNRRNNDEFPSVMMNNVCLKYEDCVKYLGYVINKSLSDNDDIDRQMKSIYVKANILNRKFKYCNDAVKIHLFKSYCCNVYCCNVWGNYTIAAINKIQVAYNNSYRIFMQLPKFCSASAMFAYSNVLGFDAILRKQRFNMLRRLKESTNVILQNIMLGDWSFQSPLLNIYYNSLYV